MARKKMKTSDANRIFLCDITGHKILLSSSHVLDVDCLLNIETKRIDMLLRPQIYTGNYEIMLRIIICTVF